MKEAGRKYLLVIIFLYFTLPLGIVFIKGGIRESLMFGYLYALNPIMVFADSLMYAVRHGFEWKFPVMVGVLFIPSALIYFHWQDIVFALTYGIFSFIGAAFGTLIKKLL